MHHLGKKSDKQSHKFSAFAFVLHWSCSVSQSATSEPDAAGDRMGNLWWATYTMTFLISNKNLNASWSLIHKRKLLLQIMSSEAMTVAHSLASWEGTEDRQGKSEPKQPWVDFAQDTDQSTLCWSKPNKCQGTKDSTDFD